MDAHTHTHTPRWCSVTPITRTHTLTTYCLASKAYVGRPRVLFMSSLWQMSERGDCCCGGCQREYSFVSENSKKKQKNSADVLSLYMLPLTLTPKKHTHKRFLFFNPAQNTYTRAYTVTVDGLTANTHRTKALLQGQISLLCAERHNTRPPLAHLL